MEKEFEKVEKTVENQLVDLGKANIKMEADITKLENDVYTILVELNVNEKIKELEDGKSQMLEKIEEIEELRIEM